MRQRRVKTRGITLVELLVALVIVSIISVATTTMLAGAAKTDRFVMNASLMQSQAEFATRRMIHNLRMASSITGLTTTDGGTFTLVTQPDTANDQATYTVTYALVTLGNGTKQLQETDTRTGMTVLVSEVTTFTARYQNAGSPKLVVVTLTTGGPYAVTRTFKVAPRNL